MATVLRQTDKFGSDGARRRRNRIVFICVVAVGIGGVIEGLVFGSYYTTSWRLALLLAVLYGVLALNKWGFGIVQELEKKHDNLARRAAGEKEVAQIIEGFPNDFRVIHDVPTPQGMLDHVVVGPTGIYVLLTKSWRGAVAADGQGELLINGRPTERPEIRQFMGRMLALRERVQALAPGIDVQLNPVLVFTAAWVEARWGTTKSVDCVRYDKLHEYVVGRKYARKMSGEEISRISQAFLELAQMDKELGVPTAHLPGDGKVVPPAGLDRTLAVRPAVER